MARCLKPITLKDKGGVQVPCGRCIACKKTRASHWTFRILEEAKAASSSFFVTLTYENAPISENGFMTLEPNHITEFMKAFRKVNPKKLRFYAVGEYGSKFGRPHYHIILFNAEISTLMSDKEYKFYEKTLPILDGKEQFHCKQWQHGHITIGNLEPRSAAYCMQYIDKGTVVPLHDRDDRVREFARMSKGIGKQYLNEEQLNWHYADPLRQYAVTDTGKKITLPRYYKERIYTIDEREAVNEYYKALEHNDLVVLSTEDMEKLAHQKRKIAENPRNFRHGKSNKKGSDPF